MHGGARRLCGHHRAHDGLDWRRGAGGGRAMTARWRRRIGAALILAGLAAGPVEACVSNALDLKRDFGAVGDDRADDTASLSRWLAACIVRHRVCYAPAGTYRHTETLVVDTAPGALRVCGDGPLLTTFRLDSRRGVPALRIDAPTLQIDRLRLHDFALAPPTTAAIGNIGLAITNQMRALIERVGVSGHYQGVVFRTSYATAVRDSIFVGNIGQALLYENDGSANNALIDHNRFLSNGINAGANAVDLLGAPQGGMAPVVRANDFEGNAGGIGVGTVYSATIAGNYFENQVTNWHINIIGAPRSLSVRNNYFQATPLGTTWSNLLSLELVGNTFNGTSLAFGVGMEAAVVRLNTAYNGAVVPAP
jgi:hypothetical protein